MSARARLSSNASRNGSGPYVLVTGGAGFIGVNLANRLLEEGRHVVVLDNLSRPGVERNLSWLREKHGERVGAVIGDVRDAAAVEDAVRGADFVYHFAAQVAVTTSLDTPRHDFEVNALGTINVLEAARRAPHEPAVLFLSTNKVYGDLSGLELERSATRWMPVERRVASSGIAEDQPLAFHTPYGCSKGAADQYVLDYARVLGLRSAVFRMSCIYGPHQLGTEDQGWVAHFVLRTLAGQAITLYGDGRQVRDILFVEDLVDALTTAAQKIDALTGEAFNIGGGPANSVSLIEILDRLREITGESVDVEFGPWRHGDQKYYVSNTEKFRRLAGWSPRVNVDEGLTRLHAWLVENRAADGRALSAKRVRAH